MELKQTWWVILHTLLIHCVIITIGFKAQKPYEPEAHNPLILTPFIQSGEIEKAQELSRVSLYEDHFASYSGFFTVNPTWESNLFFWYIPAKHETPKTPVLLWLNGGPGCSSLFGLFVEHGPIIVNETSIVHFRETPWTLKYSVLYVDSPVGTGFSFTQNESGYAKNIAHVTHDLYSAVSQFFQLFPYLRHREFYLTGESYAGKYIPHLAYHILGQNNLVQGIPTLQINLSGISIGNGFIDPYYSLDYPQFLFDLGFIDENHKVEASRIIAQIRKLILKEKWNEAFLAYDKFIGYSGRSPNYISTTTGLNFYYNILTSERPPDYDYYIKYLMQDSIREGLHVSLSVSFGDEAKVMEHLQNDIMQSAKGQLEYLLNNGIPTLLYSGQLDLIVPNRLTNDLIHNLEWYGVQKFLHTPRTIWSPENSPDQVLGYFTTYRNFTRLTVRNCGHILPYDNSLVGLQLIDAFINNKFATKDNS